MDLRDELLASLENVRAELMNQRKLLQDFHRLHDAWKAEGFKGELLDGVSSNIKNLEYAEQVISSLLQEHPPQEPDSTG